MNPANLTDQIEDALDGVPQINRQQHRERIIRLIRRAVPGSPAFWQLANQYGFQFDYSPADHGEPVAGFSK